MRTSIGFGVGPVRVSQRVGLPRRKAALNHADAGALVDAVQVVTAVCLTILVAYFAYPAALAVLVYGLLGSFVIWVATRFGAKIPPSTSGVVRRETLNQAKAVAMWPAKVWNRFT
jgi:hypothetical protein